MSEIQVGQINSTDGSTAITTGADGYVSFAKTQIGGRRNLIINGAMQVAQRGNTTNNNGVFVADRFMFRTNGLGAAGAVIAASTQSTVVPSGFASALKTNVTTAGSGFSADNRNGFAQKLETQDVAHLFDAGNSFTLSFWVRSSLATTYGLTLTLLNRDTTSTGDQYATSYTINSADTWEKKTITIPATTSSRSGGDDNSTGLHIYWNLEMISGGSRSSATANAWADNVTTDQVVSAAADTGWMSSTNDFYITGVQLEVGTVASPFEHISYGEQLALCQRYYQRFGEDGDAQVLPFAGQCVSSSVVYFMGQTYAPMRTQPSGSSTNPSNFRVRNASNSGLPSISSLGVTAYSESYFVAVAENASGLTAGHASHLFNYNGSSYGWIELDAEL